MRIILLFLLLCPVVLSQPQPSPTAGPPNLLAMLIPIFAPRSNEAGQAMVPIREVVFFQTPYIIRSGVFFALAQWEITAACHPVALSYFGIRDSVDPTLCTPLSRVIILHHFYLRMNQVNFPNTAAIHARFLTKVGLNPNDLSLDQSTPVGYANMAANRALNYFNNDGWNSPGDLNREKFRMPFSDYTGYQPVNLAERPESKLRKPLRWQPLTKPSDISPGEYVSQKHVTPFLGNVRPLALTAEDLEARNPKSPYVSRNKRGTLSRKDRAKMEQLITDYFRISSQLTVPQRFKAFFWDRKFIAFAFTAGFYNRALGVDMFNSQVRFLGESTAQHDALVVAWRAKRRMDLVRPTTIIRKLWAGRKVMAFVGLNGGVQEVKAEEYEPLIPIQPHSEYPSASAIICRASLETLELTYKSRLGQNITFPPFEFPIRGGLFPVPIAANFTLRFDTVQDLYRDCAKSRLWAGVHFKDSIKEGLKLGAGIGEKVFNQINALAEGRVPDFCPRCI